MNPVMTITVIPFILALIISLVVTPITIIVFKKRGWLVDPAKTPHPAHIHKNPVPKGGGIPIFFAVTVTVALLLKPDSHLLAIGVAGLVALVVGVIDDVRSSSPYARLVMNFLVTAIIVGSGIGIAYVSNPLGGVIDLTWPRWGFDLFGKYHEVWILADIFALLWIPSLMNAINWSSGVDGQISGVITVAAIVLGLISLSYSADITQWPVATLAFATAGAFAGLTAFHFYPQKIMPGYSATSLAGLLLGVISILATAKVGALIIVLGIPLIDFLYLLTKRILSGKSPVWGDRSHLHHKLMAMGWGKRRIALFYWLAAVVLGIAALSITAQTKLLVIIGLVILMTVFIIWQYSSRSSQQ